VRDLLNTTLTELIRPDISTEIGPAEVAPRRTQFPYGDRGFQFRTFGTGRWLPVDLTVTRLAVKPRPVALLTVREIQHPFGPKQGDTVTDALTDTKVHTPADPKQVGRGTGRTPREPNGSHDAPISVQPNGETYS
jgi:hypothetical protein